MKTRPTSIRLSEEGRRIIDALAQYFGISKTAVVEMALRDLHRKQKRKAEKGGKE
jgi:predicted transcriptional regulator